MRNKPEPSYTNREAAEVVARLERYFKPPYKLVGYYRADEVDPGNVRITSADIQGQKCQTLDEIYDVFRAIVPHGDFMFVHGTVPQFKRPGAMVGTTMIEKRRRFRANQEGKAGL